VNGVQPPPNPAHVYLDRDLRNGPAERRAAGLVTPDVLRGPRFLRLFPDTYVTAHREGPPDLKLRSLAAYRYVEGKGVLSGYSAAEVLGASCGPWDAAAEVTLPHRGQRSRPGLLVHRTSLHPGEITDVGGLKVTTPLRTAYDLARRGDLVERVVAVDRLANVHRFDPNLLLNFSARYHGVRGNELVPIVLAYADRRAGLPHGDPASHAHRAGRPADPRPGTLGIDVSGVRRRRNPAHVYVERQVSAPSPPAACCRCRRRPPAAARCP
jgi:hypothetical protein